jgi:creatinine amidohydrolase
MRPYVLAETTWKQVQTTGYSIALLPWGATEAHNYHLPYATDVIETESVAIESARIAWEKGAKVVSLPVVPFGVQTGQQDIDFCINMNPSTQAAVLRDVAATLDARKTKALVVINGHGGNDFKQMIRELQPSTRMLLVTVNWWQVGDAKVFTEPGDHGGELETSVMLHVAPSLVRPLGEAGAGRERKPKIAGLRERWAWTPRPWSAVSEDTGIGNPKAATAEKGREFFRSVTEKIALLLVDLDRADLSDLYDG